MTVDEPDILWRLGLALLLSAAIGLEREWSQKDAGLRTYTLVGLGSALFVAISKYGFADVLGDRSVNFDPSRVASLIVSGIGFIGAGVIFVRRDAVHGLTTAAGIWVTAAVGAAAGASLWLLAVATTAAYFFVAFGLSELARRLPRSPHAPSAVRIVYADGHGVLRPILATCAEQSFKVADVAVDRRGSGGGEVAVTLEVCGRGSVAALTAELCEIDGVHRVDAGDVNEAFG
jgi:putative Mg2+ transporter-C (MgtC) family protein